MKFPFFSRPSTLSRSGFRSCAVVCSICAALASGSARADLTEAQMTAALVEALKEYSEWSSGYDYMIQTIPVGWEQDAIYATLKSSSSMYFGGNTTAADLLVQILRSMMGIGGRTEFRNMLSGVLHDNLLTIQNDLHALTSLTNSPALSPTDVSTILSHLSDINYTLQGYASDLSSIADSVSSIDLLFNSVASHIQFDFRDDVHGTEVLVAAPDLEWLLEGFNGDFLQYASNWSSILEGIYNALAASISAPNPVTNILNDGFGAVTNSFDPGSEVYSWDSSVYDIGASESESDALVDDATAIASVTNAVGNVATVSTNDQSLAVRQQVFEPLNSGLLTGLDHSFSSDVLILPAIEQFHIPRLEWAGDDDAWQSFLSRSGRLMSNVYDVLYVLFLMFLIWREYNFYFKTM